MPATVTPHVVMLGAAGLSGVGFYCQLIVAARSLSGTDFSNFSIFWAFVVVMGAGAFLPIEQELSRRVAGLPGAPRSGDRRWRAPVAATLVVSTLALVLALAGSATQSAAPESGVLLVGVVIAIVGYALQSPVRGMLAGARRLHAYAAVVATEGAARVLFSGVAVLVAPGSLTAQVVVFGLAPIVSVLPALVLVRPIGRQTGASAGQLLARIGRTAVAALLVQVLLNFPPVIAFVSTGGSGTLPGVLLTAVALARIPAFVYFAVQAGMVPRIAAALAVDDRATARARVRWLVASCGAMVVVWTALLAIAGPWVSGILFGSSFALEPMMLITVAGSLGLLLIAISLSDATIATGGHTVATLTWVGVTAIGLATALLIADPVLQATAPVGLAAVVASVVLTIVLRVRLSGRATPPATAATPDVAEPDSTEER